MMARQPKQPFTPEQEARLRQIAREEALVAVAAGAGDIYRLLHRFGRIHNELGLGTASEMPHLKRLAYLSALALDQGNAERGRITDFARAFEERHG